MARTIIIKDNRTGFKYKTKNENILDQPDLYYRNYLTSYQLYLTSFNCFYLVFSKFCSTFALLKHREDND